jgi:hypothetical protein
MKTLKILLLVLAMLFPVYDTNSKIVSSENINTNIGLEMFMEDLGYKESGGRYNIVNQYGYMGKYQFSANTLRLIGIKTTKNQFLNNPKLQDEAMIRLLKHNKEKLQPYIKMYDGKIVKNYVITESGILAAAHLAGAGNVEKYFITGRDFKDGNGTKLTYYMTKFSGYELNI